jgi:hypothetical protein
MSAESTMREFGLPESHILESRLWKATQLKDLACRTMDALDTSGVFYGDEEALVQAKHAIDEACRNARDACYEVMRAVHRKGA